MTANTTIRLNVNNTRANYRPPYSMANSGFNPQYFKPSSNLTSSPTKTVTVNQPTSSKPEQRSLNVEEMEFYSKQSVDELEAAKEKNPQLADEFDKLIESKKTNIQTESQAPEGGKITNIGNPDDEEPNDDKFDIQQGDFIEFLMKDIVLASAAWAGKKVSGYAGLYLYKASSAVYHFTSDKIEAGWESIKESAKEGQERFNNYCESFKDNKVNINDLETGSYARNLFERHNEKIDSIEKASLNREALANFAAYICDPNRKEEITLTEGNNGKTYWTDKKTGKKVPITSQYSMQLLEQIGNAVDTINNNQNLTPEQKAGILKNLSQSTQATISKTAVIQGQMDVFCTNMVTALKMHDNLNGAKLNEEQEQKQDKEYLEMSKHLFLSYYKDLKEKKEIAEGINSVEDLIKLSEKAMKTSFDNARNGNFKEKDKTPTNTALNTIIHLANNRKTEEKEESLMQSAIRYTLHSEERLEDAESNIKALNLRLQENDAARKKAKEARDNIEGKSPDSQKQSDLSKTTTLSKTTNITRTQ